jgi:hypothetical protein
MKYYVYSFIWKAKGSSTWNSGTDLFEGNSAVELYENTVQQPETWCITSFAEITKAEYDMGCAKGIIG